MTKAFEEGPVRKLENDDSGHMYGISTWQSEKRKTRGQKQMHPEYVNVKVSPPWLTGFYEKQVELSHYNQPPTVRTR